MFPAREMALQKPSTDETVKRLQDIANVGLKPLVVGLDAGKVAITAMDALALIEKLREKVSEQNSEIKLLKSCLPSDLCPPGNAPPFIR